MRDKTDQAIVLRAIQYGERDKLVTLFLRESGRRKGIAKGASNSRRRFGPALEPGSIIQVICQETPRSEWLLLKEASLLEHSLPWRRSWKGMVVAGYCLELAGRLLPENKQAQDKFELLRHLLTDIREADAVEKLLLFEKNWISLSGWAPQWERDPSPTGVLEPAELQKILDGHWEELLGKPLASKKLLEQIL